MKNPQWHYVLLAPYLLCWGSFVGGTRVEVGLGVRLEFCSQGSVPCRQVLLFFALVMATSSAGFSIPLPILHVLFFALSLSSLSGSQTHMT